MGTKREDLQARMAQIQARLDQMDQREAQLGDLKAWCEQHGWTVTDIGWAYRRMRSKRAIAPVKSRRHQNGLAASHD